MAQDDSQSPAPSGLWQKLKRRFFGTPVEIAPHEFQPLMPIHSPPPQIVPPHVSDVPPLVYDDDLVDCHLYDDARNPSCTAASLFGPGRQLEVRLASVPDPLPESAVREILAVLRGHHPLTAEFFVRLAQRLKNLLPVYPKPPSPDMPPSVGEALECLWQDAISRDADLLAAASGEPLWEWHELARDHEKARDVLRKLVGIYQRLDKPKPGGTASVESGQDQGQESDWLRLAARAANDLAFQFQQEQRWSEAAAAYDHAALMEAGIGADNDAAARVNYWRCRFEMDGRDVCELAHSELLRLEPIVARQRQINARRTALVFCARMEILFGDLRAAEGHAATAVEIDRELGSRHIGKDEALLRQIRQSMK